MSRVGEWLRWLVEPIEYLGQPRLEAAPEGAAMAATTLAGPAGTTGMHPDDPAGGETMDDEPAQATGDSEAGDGQDGGTDATLIGPPVPPAEPEVAPEPPPEPEAAPYADSDEHLWDALWRVDLLVRAQTEIWQETLAIHKTLETVGCPHVGSGEVDAFLADAFGLGPAMSAAAWGRVEGYLEQSDAVARRIERRRAATPAEIELRVERLRERCGLDDAELLVVLVCLLPEIDGRYRRLYGYLMDDLSRQQPTVALATEIAGAAWPRTREGRELFDGDGALRRHRLVELGDEEPLSVRSVRLDDRIADYLLGSDAPDGRLNNILIEPAEPLHHVDFVAELDEADRLQKLAAWWHQAREARRGGATLLLHGPYGSGRRTTARVVCAATGTPLLIVGAEAAVRAGGWEETVERAYREALLRDAAVCWHDWDPLLTDEFASARETLLAAAERYQGLTILIGKTAWDPAERYRATPFLAAGFGMPRFELRRALWTTWLRSVDVCRDQTPGLDELAEELANGFQLTPGQMRDALATATWRVTLRDPARRCLNRDDLYEGCRRQSSRHLIAFAKRIEPRPGLTFDDLILPRPNKRQLTDLGNRLRDQGRVRSAFEQRLTLGQGLVVLFTGGSGTGKTMAAEILARGHGLDLYKVDLSAIVSKWVGETEKNLNRVFADAADANAILFFDEADALFGQRAKVEHAQDRWANMEVNYLLQRVEEYAGVVILASNLRQNIDEAFMRRVQVAIDFPFPEPEARLEIVRGLLPATVAPPSTSDLRALAERFRLAGGSWKNIVVDATFRAYAETSDGRPILTMRHLALATAREYQKLGKPLTLGEFGETYFAWVMGEIL